MNEFQPQPATLVLSIDLLDADDRSAACDRELAERLLHIVRARRLPVTWAVARPGATPLVDTRFGCGAEAEVALLGDESWVGGRAGRTRFAHELGERIRVARDAGLHVSTLAVRDLVLRDHLDLLVKHRISVIRGPATKDKSLGDLQPQSPRFGVWYAGASLVTPQPEGWNWGGTNRAVRRAVRKAIQTGGFLQIVVEAERLTTPRALHQFDLMTAHLQRQRDKGLLRLRTLRGVVQRLIPRSSPISSRSVLNAA